MTSERIKEIQQKTAYPDSISVQQALLQVWNECSQLPQQETLYTEEQIRKLIEEANYDGQSLHAKSVTRQMMRDNAESYSNEIIESLKQPKND